MYPARITPAIASRQLLQSRLRDARSRSDELFAMLRPDALYQRPIPERNRIIFYLGHFETFDWNLICDGVFGMKSIRREFDRLFAFGIDPTDGNLPQDRPGDWPGEAEVRDYNRLVRQAMDSCLERATEDQLFHVAIEHRLMHAETLTYMFHRLPVSMLSRPTVCADADLRPVQPGSVQIPAGSATLGMHRQADSFGWDNEFNAVVVDVPAFRIDIHKVTNDDYLKFVRAGGYQEKSLWSESAWQWIRNNDIRHPQFWQPRNGGFSCRMLFAEVPFQPFHPVYVSQAEAQAYAQWKGKSLPTEAQFHRAAFGTPSGAERTYPWGEAHPGLRHGVFAFNSWDPMRVDAHPDGASAFGVLGLVGNGWEWTSTKFAPFPGFEPFKFYPSYSADFFDGNHYVTKGGSARTAVTLLRRSFRNFFQPHYPNTYTGFRCVEEV
jgi:ergothioneine biosynthesis protein EgtB